MKKVIMQPGRRYRGYGYINEYGEMKFEPAQQSDSPNLMRVVDTAHDVTLYESGTKYKISVRLSKGGGRNGLIKQLLRQLDIASLMLAKYIN